MSAAAWAFAFFVIATYLQGLVSIGSADISRLAGLLSVGTSVLSWIAKGVSSRGLRQVTPWAVFGAFALASGVWSRSPDLFLPDAMRFGLVLLVIVAFALTRQRQDETSVLMRVTAAAGLAAAVIGTVQSLKAGAMAGRVMLGVKDPNFLAFSLTLPTLAALDTLYGTRRRLQRLCWTLAAAGLIAGLLVTGSRGGMVSLGAGLAVWLWINRGTDVRPTLIASVGVLLAAVLLSIQLADLSPYLSYAIRRSFSLGTAYATGGAGRINILEQYLSIQPDLTLLGRGLGATSTSGGGLNAFGLPIAPHNTVAQVVLELGIVGSCLFAAAFATTLSSVYSLSMCGRREAGVVTAAMIAAMVGGMTLHVLWQKEFWVVIALALSVCRGFRKSSGLSPVGAGRQL